MDHEACARVANPSYGAVPHSACSSSAGNLEPSYDFSIDQFGEGEDLRSDERPGHEGHHQNGDDLRDKCESDLLDLRQCLNQRDDDTDDHCCRDRRSCSNDDGPNGCPYKLKGIDFVHRQLTMMPGPRRICSPPLSLATAPSLAIVTDNTSPEILPSAVETVQPMTLSACAHVDEESSASSLELLFTVCSTWEKVAS